MATYNAKYIPDMTKANPTGADPKKEGDDAIREIKDVLQTTFPNFETNASLNASVAELNALVSTAIVRGTVVMWGGDQGLYPEGPPGWTVCDGRPRKSGGGTAPDLRGSFIMGARLNSDSSAPLVPQAGTTGGNNETVIKDFNGDLVELNTQGHVLTSQEIPPHEHVMLNNDGDGTDGNLTNSKYISAQGTSAGRSYDMTASTGGVANVGKTGPIVNQSNTTAHSHKLTISTTGTGSNIPQYYGLIYIIKD